MFLDSAVFDAQCDTVLLTGPKRGSGAVGKSLVPLIAGVFKPDSWRVGSMRANIESMLPHAEAIFEYVGDYFSSKARGIYGEATARKMEGLLDNGIREIFFRRRRKSDAWDSHCLFPLVPAAIHVQNPL